MLKKTILFLHKWLGLISGLVILISSLTGCIYVFQDELKLMLYPEKYILTETVTNDSPTLPLTKLISIAEKQLAAGEKVSRIDISPAKNRTWTFRAVKTNKKAFFYSDYFVYHKRVFLNPYSGKVQAVENTKTEFFQIVLQLHLNLLLGKKYGHLIIGTSTLIFGLISLTGLFLWWPKKWKAKKLKPHFTIKWNAKIKRFVYDLHSVFGFYVLLFALLFCITGLFFAFPAFKKTVAKSLNGNEDKTISQNQFPKVASKTNTVLDNAVFHVLAKHPEADQLSIRIQKEPNEPQDIQVRLEKNKTSVYYWYYFDQKTGAIKKIKDSNRLALGDKITSYNYDLHTGTIGGLPTKIIAFLAAFICASLPITGFWIWLNKSQKKANK